MTTIAHLSDLHFGTEEPAIADALAEDLRRERPTVIAVSGDVTQRAKDAEFRAARAWLDSLPAPSLVVPGNHDVPLWNVARRLFRPLDAFHEYFDGGDPEWHDDNLLLLGVNTARSGVVSAGRVNEDQIERVKSSLESLGEGRLRVVVAHHPFAPGPRHGLVGRSGVALAAFACAGLDLVLAGHHHVGFAGDLRDWHVGLTRAVLVSHAGTAFSRRRRGEENAWTRIDVSDPDRIRFEVHGWDGRKFRPTSAVAFRRAGDHWEKSHLDA